MTSIPLIPSPYFVLLSMSFFLFSFLIPGQGQGHRVTSVLTSSDPSLQQWRYLMAPRCSVTRALTLVSRLALSMPLSLLFELCTVGKLHGWHDP